MKTPQFPAPKGMPARRGKIQWTFGVHVLRECQWLCTSLRIDKHCTHHAKIISPTGTQTAAMTTTLTMASG